MSQMLSVNSFEWVEDTSQLKEDFIKSYNDESEEGFFFEVHVQYSKNLYNLHNDLSFLLKGWKFERFIAHLHNKTDTITH